MTIIKALKTWGTLNALKLLNKHAVNAGEKSHTSHSNHVRMACAQAIDMRRIFQPVLWPPQTS